MLNTGYLLAKPGESGYAMFRRFLIANLAQKNIRQLVNLEVKKTEQKINSQIKRSHNSNSYKLAQYVREYEKQFFDTKLPNSGHRVQNIDLPIKYRPKKQCVFCSEIGYHTNIFDLPWLDTCPIHNSELLEFCPECRERWPSSSGLINNECHVCGKHLTTEQISKKYKLFSDYKSRFHFVKYLQDILFSQNYKSVHRLKTKSNNLMIYTPERHKLNIIVPSILLTHKDLKISEKKLIFKLGVPTYKILTKHYSLKKCRKNEEIPQISDKNIYNEKVKILIKQKLSRILVNCKYSIHQPGKCLIPDNACIPCGTWHIWNAIVDTYYNEKIQYAGRWLQFLDSIYLNVKPELPKLQTHIYECPDTKYPTIQNIMTKYRIPKSLQLLILYIDYWTLAINVFHYFEHYKLLIDKYKKITFSELRHGMQPFMLPDNTSFCPMHMSRESKNDFKVFYPKDLIFTSLPLQPNVQQLISY